MHLQWSHPLFSTLASTRHVITSAPILTATRLRAVLPISVEIALLRTMPPLPAFFANTRAIHRVASSAVPALALFPAVLTPFIFRTRCKTRMIKYNHRKFLQAYLLTLQCGPPYLGKHLQESGALHVPCTQGSLQMG